MSYPRDKFKLVIEPEAFQGMERIYLNIAIWPGTKDPSADVIRVSVDGLKNGEWGEVEKISIYRDDQGYRELPKRPFPPSQKQNKIESSVDKENEIKKELDDKPPDNLFDD
jgi:hypothetical protein